MKENTIEVREYYERGELRERCHECGSLLRPGDRESMVCNGGGGEPRSHCHVNVYFAMS
jgi:hypothetical protein